MRIGLHNEPSSGAIGGSEASVAVLAQALARAHEVTIVHHRRDLTRERLATLTGLDLSSVEFRYVEPVPFPFGSAHLPHLRLNEAREWGAELSAPYDAFVTFTHDWPPFCHARIGVLVVLFPLRGRPFDDARSGETVSPWSVLKRVYHAREWSARMRTYRHKLANSEFTCAWTRARWGIDCEVVHPPVELDAPLLPKEDLVLSVGRFATEGHSKHQLELVRAFRESAVAESWRLVCAGAVGDAPEDVAYVESVRAAAEGSHARVLTNLPRSDVVDLYARAKVFWHAAGLGEPPDRPERLEHFGIATVEAMAAGCVPIVIARGGQPDIVEHGVNGFLWETLHELRAYTAIVAENDALRARMPAAARERARRFSRSRFVERFERILGAGERGARRPA